MAVVTGHYEPKTAKRVTHWPKPDVNGDGEQVWEDQFDGQGNYVGRQQATDSSGRPIFHYAPPEGFRNMASKEAGSDGVTDNYVLLDDRGKVWRHPKTGEAAGIRPGTTLVQEPNGDFYLLTDDFSRYLFEKNHEKVEAPENDSLVARPKTPEEEAKEREAEDKAEFEQWKKDQAAKKDVA